MKPLSRKEIFLALFPNLPDFRFRQIQQALFVERFRSVQEVSSLSKELREQLKDKFPWFAYTSAKVLKSRLDQTHKAVLTLQDDCQIETVLMPNAKGHWTICISCQVGCPMNCVFCNTGKMGLIRDLTVDEIVDQYRFWQQKILSDNLTGQITNLVFMGMGEPLLNYEPTKTAIELILKYTLIGKTCITVSTIGNLFLLNKILQDASWPQVKVAISLHSAIRETRQRLVPNMPEDYYQDIIAWSKKFIAGQNQRRQHITFEYVLIKNLNDNLKEAEALVKLAKKIGKIKVNLIPYNATKESYDFEKSSSQIVEKFQKYLEKNGVDVFCRKERGGDIGAACGQLITANQIKTKPLSG